MTTKVPACIGIILDGNRRWAKENHVSTFEGHQKGIDAIEHIACAARDMGIRHMVIYAFSTENWNRSPEEISYLMQLFESLAQEQVERLLKEQVAVRFVGQRDRFASKLQTLMAKTEKNNPRSPKLTLWICLSYGGRAEIIAAAQAMIAAQETITEESLSNHLWTRGMPDPDLIIRTGGTQRLSNFLPWQSVYSELFFLEKYWPDFTKEDLQEVLKEYRNRERRMGK
jgi:undecaprenyl diphosphate synthase